jgi:hypothetical protein
MAVASGWMERAASLLEDTEECAGHGWLILDRARSLTMPKSGMGLPPQRWQSRGASGDVDLEYDALSLLGQSYGAGRVSGNEAA